MRNNLISHKPAWTKFELEIVYKNYTKLSLKELAKLLPNRTLSAIKNKVKKIKYA